VVIGTAEVIVRVAGAAVFAVAWVAGAVGGARGLRHAPGRASGLATTLRAFGTYAVVVGPYLMVCVALWRPLPVTFGAVAGWIVLDAGTVLGAFGAVLYLWGRSTLGEMYNVSSAFGCELFTDHRLVTWGPYRFVRHPMYVGLFAAATGALLVYQVWTMVFVIACLPGAWFKAQREDRLLAEQFGAQFQDYRRMVPGWLPRRSWSGSSAEAGAAARRGPVS
jgi:protein-S-isoprenylcysteine O-methyltransferase Ste14